MSNKLVQVANRNNRVKTINYCLTNEPYNKKRNTIKHSNISLPIVTHDNSSLNNITLLANLQKNSNSQ
jgi:hypothetical protein